MGAIFISNYAVQKKEAKQLADQTEAFAKVFSQYMNYNFSQISSAAVTGPVIISPQSIKWPADLANNNMFGQIPCVTITKNKATGDLEAVLYYVNAGSATIGVRSHVVRDAAIFLGSKGGVLSNGEIKGNSGWSVSSGSDFLSSASQCGGSLANNSVSVNLDLMEEWNQNLQPSLAITKEVDKGNVNDITTLPGHMVNSNTSKANIYFSANNGVILDNSNPNNPVKLSVSDNGASTNSPTLGLGNNVTTLLANTMQPHQHGRAGDPCQDVELGKTIADQGSTIPSASQVLARNTLVCTHNDMLCATTNITHDCYLPSITNSIVYKNNTQGIQDNSGRFVCPSAVPFASNPKLASGANGYYYASNAGNTIGCEFATNTDGGCWRPSHYTDVQCPLPFTYSGGCGGYDGPEIRSFGLQAVTGSSHPMTFNSIGGSIAVEPVVGLLGQYQATIGYSVNSISLNINCDSVCAQLPATPTGGWVKITGNPSFNNTNYGTNSCGCWSTIPGIAQALAVVVLQQPQAILTSVTCSNMPYYTK
jgi:hypothetical protein